jgi:hypothetical protein
MNNNAITIEEAKAVLAKTQQERMRQYEVELQEFLKERSITLDVIVTIGRNGIQRQVIIVPLEN